jgi:23S rRNA A2030 N6-methylase RlmJ
VKNADGFDGLKSQLPPSTRRAVVLMDPSYEGNGDYGRVVAALRGALSRFAEGRVRVWYPQGAEGRGGAAAGGGWSRSRPRAGCTRA